MTGRKKFFAAIICCILMGSLCTNAYAAERHHTIIRQEDIAWEAVDLSQVEFDESGLMPLTTASVNKSISSQTVCTVSPLISLQADDVVALTLNTGTMTNIWSTANSEYQHISCYNYGDTDTGQGAVRFIINGVIQDVAAGTGANFSVSRGAYVTVSAQALWYNGTYNIQVDAAKS